MIGTMILMFHVVLRRVSTYVNVQCNREDASEFSQESSIVAYISVCMKNYLVKFKGYCETSSLKGSSMSVSMSYSCFVLKYFELRSTITIIK